MPSRRAFVRLTLGTSAAVALRAIAAAAQSPLPATPACGADGGPTPAQTEGPYFKPSSPERASLLEPALTGARLVDEVMRLAKDPGTLEKMSAAARAFAKPEAAQRAADVLEKVAAAI